MKKLDRVTSVYEEITNKIIESLENGNPPWLKTWSGGGVYGLPVNGATGNAYNGTNILSLWIAQEKEGFNFNKWMTFKQAKELGGTVQKGSKSQKILFAKPVTTTKEIKNLETGNTEDAEFSFMATKVFSVFNVDQIEGLPVEFYEEEKALIINEEEKNQKLEDFIKSTGANIFTGGNKAYNDNANNLIKLPKFEHFETASNYYATVFHELTHWTRHETRLNRFKGTTSEAYAKEELVAELGSAFLCAELGVKGDLRHASYIEGWLKALRNDPKFIVQAASKASEAVRFLKGEKVKVKPKQEQQCFKKVA